MPVVLHEEDEERWLTCSFDEAVALAVPFPSQLRSVCQAKDPAREQGEAEDDAGGEQAADEPSLGLFKAGPTQAH